MLFESIGTLHYGDNKLVVQVDPGISLFYRSLIPKWHRINLQRYPPHISVVRKETSPRMELWGKYEGERIRFFYDIDVQNDSRYWWLNIFCVRLEEIRRELGLPVSSPYTLPPVGFEKCFHMTIGNTKSCV